MKTKNIPANLIVPWKKVTASGRPAFKSKKPKDRIDEWQRVLEMRRTKDKLIYGGKCKVPNFRPTIDRKENG